MRHQHGRQWRQACGLVSRFSGWMHNRLKIAVHALALWLILIVAEIVHGIVRGVFLVPRVGEFRSSQIGVFTGSVIILAVTWLFVRVDRCLSVLQTCLASACCGFA